MQKTANIKWDPDAWVDRQTSCYIQKFDNDAYDILMGWNIISVYIEELMHKYKVAA
jgi:hypothetical protein